MTQIHPTGEDKSLLFNSTVITSTSVYRPGLLAQLAERGADNQAFGGGYCRLVAGQA